MEQCANCGHALGVGRYCVNCGQPRGQSQGQPPGPTDDPSTTTAERAAVPGTPGASGAPSSSPPTQLSEPTQSPWGPTTPATPATPPATRPTAPPPVYETPQQARYPMYADDAPVTAAAQRPAWESANAGDTTGNRGGRRSVLPWVLVAVTLLLVAVTGVFLLVGGSGDQTADDPSTGASPDPAGSTGPTDPVSPASDPPSTDPVSPSTDPVPTEPEDVARKATAIAPDTAPPGVDVDGNAVRYDAFNMLDGQDDTAWRTPGDATGKIVGFDLTERTRLTTIGLLNGYAKSVPGYDGYTANRRVLAVEWIFDDGTVVPQTLGESPVVQTIPVDVVTTGIQLKIVAVSPPARAPKGRNFTAISTVTLLGAPA